MNWFLGCDATLVHQLIPPLEPIRAPFSLQNLYPRWISKSCSDPRLVLDAKVTDYLGPQKSKYAFPRPITSIFTR